MNEWQPFISVQLLCCHGLGKQQVFPSSIVLVGAGPLSHGKFPVLLLLSPLRSPLSSLFAAPGDVKYKLQKDLVSESSSTRESTRYIKMKVADHLQICTMMKHKKRGRAKNATKMIAAGLSPPPILGE